METVPVIIINYRTSHLLQDLINSIQEDSIEVKIIILDNGSTRESLSILQKINDNRMTILESSENLGFTGGVNYTLKYIQKKFGAEVKFVFLFNPDAVITANTISGLVKKMKGREDAACISPQIIDTKGIPTYSGSQIDYKKGIVTTRINNKHPSADDVYEVDVFTGCAVLMDWKKVVEVGSYNEKLFMYFDEADLSIRLKHAGYKIMYTSDFKVTHDASYTTRKISFVKTYFMTRNKFILFGNTMSLYNKLYFIIHELAYHLKNSRIKNAYYHIKGLTDFVSGKSGNQFSEI